LESKQLKIHTTARTSGTAITGRDADINELQICGYSAICPTAKKLDNRRFSDHSKFAAVQEQL